MFDGKVALMTETDNNDVGGHAGGRRRTRKGEETRRLLVRSAVQCLTEQGYAATSVESVMAKAGVSRGSVLNQFPTRLDLMSAASEAAMRTMIADTRARFEGVDDPAQKMRRLCDMFWQTQNIPEGAAVTEVLLAARWDADLAERLRHIAVEIEVEIDADVQRIALAAGVKDVEACIVHARMLILSLRGITLELMFDPKRDVIHSALAELRAMHAAFCDRVLG